MYIYALYRFRSNPSLTKSYLQGWTNLWNGKQYIVMKPLLSASEGFFPHKKMERFKHLHLHYYWWYNKYHQSQWLLQDTIFFSCFILLDFSSFACFMVLPFFFYNAPFPACFLWSIVLLFRLITNSIEKASFPLSVTASPLPHHCLT